MSITWQDAAAAGVLLGAMGYLVRHVVRLVRRRGLPGCGGENYCVHCVHEPPAESLVTLDPPEPK